jgi:N-acetylglutamate synthase-like GNAT family acetyltransferase
MVTIDTKTCHFSQTKNGKNYEMTKGDFNGNYFLINKKPVGLCLFNIKNTRLTIINFIINPTEQKKGYARIFYEMLIDYAKNNYGCTEVYAIELTEDGNGFFNHMGLKKTDGKKYPDLRWGTI